jgi:hypothetical protein
MHADMELVPTEHGNHRNQGRSPSRVPEQQLCQGAIICVNTLCTNARHDGFPMSAMTCQQQPFNGERPAAHVSGRLPWVYGRRALNGVVQTNKARPRNVSHVFLQC